MLFFRLVLLFVGNRISPTRIRIWHVVLVILPFLLYQVVNPDLVVGNPDFHVINPDVTA